jgi:hypothetical protein
MSRSRAKKKSPRRTSRPAALESPYSFDVTFYILSFFLCFLLFRGLADNYLWNDDFEWIAGARHGMTIGNVLAYRVIGFFRPVVNLTYFAMERIAPGNIGLYYYENIFLHFLNSMLVFQFALALIRDRRIAAAAATLFLVTGVHSAAVMWISARTSLICTTFLLASVLVLARDPGSRRNLVVSIALYALALATKETAVVGAPLAGLLYLHYRAERRPTPRVSALVSFAAVTVVYFIVRFVVIGRLIQPNWGPGVHAIRNVAGGGIYQLTPRVIDWLLALTRDLFVLGKPFLNDAMLHTTHPVWPEILILPAVAAMVLVARIVNRQWQMLFALSWMLICLVPMAFLKFRFLTMDSFTHNRYYYLSSVGSCLAIVLLLSALWEAKRIRKRAKVWAAVIFFLMVVSESHRSMDREQKWHDATLSNRKAVTAVVGLLDRADGYDTCAVGLVPIRYKYFENAVLLERPQWRMLQVKGGAKEAAKHQPCVYLEFERRGKTFRPRAYTIGGPARPPGGP